MIVWILHFKFWPVRNGAWPSKDFLRLVNVSGHLPKIIVRSFEPWPAQHFSDWANPAANNVETVSVKTMGALCRSWMPCAFSFEDACRWSFGMASTRSTGKNLSFFSCSFRYTFLLVYSLKIYPLHVIMMSYCSFYRSPREESKCCQSCFNRIFYGLSSFASTNCCCAISTLQKKWLGSFSNDDATAAKTSVVLKFWRFWRKFFAIISSRLKCQMHVTFPGIEILGDRIQV